MRRCQRACVVALVVVPSLLRGNDDTEEKDAARSVSATVAPLSTAELAAGRPASRDCRGPRALLMMGSDDAEALVEFEGAAKMLAGLACFSTVRCDMSPVFCVDHNIRRTPTVLVYPRETGAMHISSGKLERQEIAALVARPIAVADRSVVLAPENVEFFLRDTLRPWKLLLFSSRKTTPVILQALSSDPELWPHVHFGFVKHTDNAILQQFRVTEVPHVVLQQGINSSTRESYVGGEMTIEGLHGWIKGLAQATAVDPGEAGIFRAIESESVVEEEDPIPDDPELAVPSPGVEGQPAPSPGRKPGPKPGGGRKPGRSNAPSPSPQRKTSNLYKVLKKGAEGCPPGQEIITLEECFKACETLGLRAQPPWISTYPGLPRWCSIRERPGGDSGEERMHFNSSPEGVGRSDLAPICKAPPPAGPAGALGPETRQQAAAQGKDPADTIPELTAASKEELFGNEGYCLIYLREGRISYEESSMLADLSEQFRLQLDHQGTKLRWMWMDLHIERKFKAQFDPPALPSAVVLNPHKRPRFAMVKHADDSEGDPLPTDQSAIALLLNTVLGGDAQFSPLPGKALKFADRSE